MESGIDPRNIFSPPSIKDRTRRSSRTEMDSKKRSPSDQTTEGDSSESPASTSRKIIDVACWACRKRKAKCSGERPACAPCIRRDVPCSYEHEEGMTRQGSLRFKLDTATSRADNLEFLFAQLQERPDNEAALLLAVIRLGADMDRLVERLRVEKGLAWLAGFSAAGEGIQGVNGVV